MRSLRLIGIAAALVLTSASTALENIDRTNLTRMVEHLRNFVESECLDPVGKWMAEDLADKILASRFQLPEETQQTQEFQKFDEALTTLAEGRNEYDKAKYLHPKGSWQRCKDLYGKGADQLDQLLRAK